MLAAAGKRSVLGVCGAFFLLPSFAPASPTPPALTSASPPATLPPCSCNRVVGTRTIGQDAGCSLFRRPRAPMPAPGQARIRTGELFRCSPRRSRAYFAPSRTCAGGLADMSISPRSAPTPRRLLRSPSSRAPRATTASTPSRSSRATVLALRSPSRSRTSTRPRTCPSSGRHATSHPA